MLVLPVYSHDARSSLMAVSQVSLPGSPSWGTVWKIQICSPVLTSKPRTSPGGISFIAGMFGLVTSLMAEPMTTTSPTTRGGEPQLKVSTGSSNPCVRSTSPPSPKSG